MLSTFFVQAQTWDGSASSDWNDPQNWTPATVPLATGNVTINSAPNNLYLYFSQKSAIVEKN